MKLAQGPSEYRAIRLILLTLIVGALVSLNVPVAGQIAIVYVEMPLPLQPLVAYFIWCGFQLCFALWLSAWLVRFLVRTHRLHWARMRLSTCMALTLVTALMVGLNATPKIVRFANYTHFEYGWPIAAHWDDPPTHPFQFIFFFRLMENILPCELLGLAAYVIWEHAIPALRNIPDRHPEKSPLPSQLPPKPLLSYDRSALPSESTLKPLFPDMRERLLGALALLALLAALGSMNTWMESFSLFLKNRRLELPPTTALALDWVDLTHRFPIIYCTFCAALVGVYWTWVSVDRKRMTVFWWTLLAVYLLGGVGICLALIAPILYEGQCVLRGSKVSTPDGDIRIEKLAIGDRVLTLASDGRVEEGKVRRIMPGRCTEYLRLELESGVELCVTKEHPLATESTWVRAEWLTAGQMVRTTTGFVSITRIERIVEAGDVYDLTVEPNANFIANGIVVHNAMKKK